MTLEELSKEYGVSRERIRQIEERAFKKLQKAMRTAHRKQREEAAVSGARLDRKEHSQAKGPASYRGGPSARHSAPDLVVLPVGAHIDGGGEPVGHVVEARDLGDVEDFLVAETRFPERRTVGRAH